MKRFFFIIAIIATVFTSCSEDDEVQTEAKLNKVTFNANNLTSELSQTKSDLVLPYYSYLLFKQDGSFVKTIQFTTETIADELEAGDYTVTLIGSDQVTGSMHTSEDYTSCYWNMGNAYTTYTGIFKGQANFTVVDNETTSVNIDLTRISCALAFNFTDLAESNRLLNVEIQNMPTHCWMGTRGASGESIFQSSPLQNTTTQLLAPSKVNDLPYLATVKITVYDDNSVIEQVRTINDVPLVANCTTTISGEILTDPTSTKNSAFDITLDETWEDPITVNF